MSSSLPALWHELLLALVGHTGGVVSCVLAPVVDPSDASSPPSYRVAGLELSPEVAVSPAERSAIDTLLKCGFHYAGLLAFTQSVDGGASLAAYPPARADGPSSTLTAAADEAEVRRLDALQARSVYSAASTMLSPSKLRRRPVEDLSLIVNAGPDAALSTALVVVPPLHPLLDDRPPAKAVGLYLRALVQGLDEVLAGYRALVLKIEQELLSEAALAPPPTTASGAATAQPHMEFGLAKLNLMLRQYMVVLPALHDVVQAIAQGVGSSSVAISPSASLVPSIHGCALLTYLHKHAATGVPLLAQVFRRLLSHLDKVLLHQLIHWMFYGLILDPFAEFFVRDTTPAPALTNDANKTTSTDPTFSSFDSLQFFHLHSSLGMGTGTGSSSSGSTSDAFDWDTAFEIVASLLPRDYFASITLVHNVLFAGKAVKILQRGERAKEARAHLRRRAMPVPLPGHARGKSRRTGSIASMTMPIPTQAVTPLLVECAPLLSQFHALRSGGGGASGGGGFLGSVVRFEELVDSLTRLLSRRLYHCLLDDHGLLTHLDHLRRFVLLGDGEFAARFLDLASETLDRPHTPRTDKELFGPSGPLKTALSQAGLVQLDEDEEADDEDGQLARQSYPLRHLRFSVDSTLPAGSGSANTWRQLACSYPVGAPLDLVISQDAMSKYNGLFRFMLEARRVQHRLRLLWSPMSIATRSTHYRARTRTGAGMATHISALLLRQSMSYVLDTLCAYMALDVVHVCWTQMVTRVKEATDFESVRKAHEDYLQQVTAHCFLKDRVVAGALADLFETCLQLTRAWPLAVSSTAFMRISEEWSRQSCFLFTVLSRKTDFSGTGGGGGGSAAFLHALVSRLDYNGHFTRAARDLGLTKAKYTQVVPNARGAVLSTEAIQASLKDARRVMQQTPSTNYGASAAHQPTSRAPASSFTPSHLSANFGAPSASYSSVSPSYADPYTTAAAAATPAPSSVSHAAYFTQANTRPFSAMTAASYFPTNHGGNRPSTTFDSAAERSSW